MKITVTDQAGEVHELEGLEGWRVMEVIRDWGLNIKAECGGACSCATCHIYVDPEWIAQLPEMQFDERELVSMLSTFRDGSSRLSCQVPFTEDLDGIKVTVAPEE